MLTDATARVAAALSVAGLTVDGVHEVGPGAVVATISEHDPLYLLLAAATDEPGELALWDVAVVVQRHRVCEEVQG